MLTGKAGIVTGAGGGIGAAIAKTLARYGASVVVNDVGAQLDGTSLGKSPAEEVAAAIRQSGGRAVADTGSVTRAEDVHTLVDHCVYEFGRLDFAIHNAGILRDKMFHKMTESDWDDVVSVHLKGAFLLSRACADVFKPQGRGALVHMTSTSGLIGNLGQANYASAKLGIVALTRSIAMDMQRFGVRCNAVAPFAWTRMTASIPASDDPVQRARIEKLKQCRPEHVAEAVAWLVSDAAQEVNGQVLSVRGDELALFSLPRPQHRFVREGGWSASDLAQAWLEMRNDAVKLQTSAEVMG